MNNLWQELRYAVRTLLRSPGFTAVAVLTMALGIGANTAVFSVLNGVLLKTLPYGEPDQIVRLWGRNLRMELEKASLSPPDIDDIAAKSEVFQSVVPTTADSANLLGSSEPIRVQQGIVGVSFFSTLGVKPASGRFFTAEDGKLGNHRVVVLSHGLWQRQFSGDKNLVGRSLKVNGDLYTVVGIAPPDFKDPMPTSLGDAEFWRPLVLRAGTTDRGGHFLSALARLKPGVTVEEAQRDMDRLTRQLELEYPETNTGWTVLVEPLLDSMVGEVRPALLMLGAAVGIVLLIACVDLANLLLVRAATRQQDFATRIAFGASRKNLVRHLMMESLVLAVAGGALGLLLAFWSSRWLVRFTAGTLPRQDQIGIDFRIIAFTFLISLLTGLLFGLAPAFRMTKPDLQAVLKEGSRGVTSGSGRGRFRSVLVVSEIALSLVLLVAAGLMVQSFRRLQGVDAGIQEENVLTLQFSLPTHYPENEPTWALYKEILERISALSGVQAAGLVNALPLGGSYSCDGFTIDYHPPVPPGQEPCAETKLITPGYFRAMGIPLLRGRYFSMEDSPKSPLVVIINQTMARRFWPNEDPLGKTVTVSAEPRTIVGIIGDVKHFSLDADAPPEVYMPTFQVMSTSRMDVVIRTSGDPLTMAEPVRKAIWSVNDELALYNIQPMQEVRANSVAQPRLRTFLVGAFALLALILSAIGIFSVMAYTVTERTHEIGIRMALGARRADVLRMVIRQAALLTLAGIVLGLAGAFALTRVLASFLFGVSTTDLASFLAGTVMLATIALLASYLPAHRATRVEPVEAFKI